MVMNISPRRWGKTTPNSPDTFDILGCFSQRDNCRKVLRLVSTLLTTVVTFLSCGKPAEMSLHSFCRFRDGAFLRLVRLSAGPLRSTLTDVSRFPCSMSNL